ncbi:hypothetical protein ADL22_12165 [Streptomyces sp. NRRL F-4489]|uniref:hypothetical protein n=1 Tax=Streptomyces sp. NRRL F-4489 TaxID=1609095 RepID=UPI000749751B|nr:hypothetical protein [Streptomyces sp. NRRL F-4489]KUL44693.1 hypothetical protein ADL22_12165 [Streptomyces sp. NRRL F-4489]
MNIAITIDGVLRNTDTDGAIPLGNALYQALATDHALYLLADDRNPSTTHKWLTFTGLTAHMRLVGPRRTSNAATPADVRLECLGHLTGTGIKLDLVIEPDPAVSVELLARGYPVTTLTLPHFAKPEWRPDYQQGLRPWAELVAETETQAQAYATDPRRSAEPL